MKLLLRRTLQRSEPHLALQVITRGYSH